MTLEDDNLCPYERQRAANIAQNDSVLRTLGLLNAAAAIVETPTQRRQTTREARAGSRHQEARAPVERPVRAHRSTAIKRTRATAGDNDTAGDDNTVPCSLCGTAIPDPGFGAMHNKDLRCISCWPSPQPKSATPIRRVGRNQAPGSKSICPHQITRCICKECDPPGSMICEHGRVRSQCKECGGGSVCEHGRRRSQCKECGGGSVCEHGRVRSRCKECGGGSVCEHGRVRSQCKECGGGSVCEHGRRRSLCKECGGGSVCEHGRRRSRCKEC